MPPALVPPESQPLKVPPRRPLVIRLGKVIRPWVNRIISRSSRVPNAPMLEASLFPWMEELRADWTVVRDEAVNILQGEKAVPPLHEISPDHVRIAGDGRWRSFFLYGYGYRIADNCRRAPRTHALLSEAPGLNSAFFSILAPGAHIPRHKGVTKGLLTCHLALIVPVAEGCRMEVESQSVSWREGECLVFDDSQSHEVWNDTNETRVVLLIQFARPTRFPGNMMAWLFLQAVRRTAFIQDARKNLAAWEQAHRHAANAPSSRRAERTPKAPPRLAPRYGLPHQGHTDSMTCNRAQPVGGAERW